MPARILGVDRYTLKDGKATEGYSYFDPRPFLDAGETRTAASVGGERVRASRSRKGAGNAWKTLVVGHPGR